MRASLSPSDALLIVDMQKDFLPGGTLAVPQGDEVVPVLNRYIAGFERAHRPIFATRDWHPANHCSFRHRGGPWPVHCVVGSPGAQFAPGLRLPASTVIISKPSAPDKETYSGFEGTDLEARLRAAGVDCLYVGGLATDYCVLHTVEAALRRGFKVMLLQDAIRAVNVHPEDGRRAEEQMLHLGAEPFELAETGTYQAVEALKRELQGPDLETLKSRSAP